jgi:hypothetical protein
MMLVPVLLALSTGVGPPMTAREAAPDPARARAELRIVESQMRSMAKGVCVDFPRKAELSRVEADYRLLKLRLDRDYPLRALPKQISIRIDDRHDCDEYEDYARYRDAALVAIVGARAALGLEN